MRRKSFFHVFAKKTASYAGNPVTFIMALCVVMIWLLTGPMFGYSDTWQLVINTGTTVITFLMVFLIQNSQNRDTRALQIKLDEIIRVTEGAHTALLDLEELTDGELKKICEHYEKVAQRGRELMRRGEQDTHVPDVDLSGIY